MESAARPSPRLEALAPAGAIDRADFAELYRVHRDGVYRYVRRLCASDDEAGDLTALTFERAFAHLDGYRGDGGGFAPWLYRIARNAALDARRRRRSWLPLEFVSEWAHPREASTPEEAIVQREASGDLLRQLDALPALQRECLLLRYGSGLTAREIGTVIGKSDQATQKLIVRALARLKENLRD